MSTDFAENIYGFAKLICSSDCPRINIVIDLSPLTRDHHSPLTVPIVNCLHLGRDILGLVWDYSVCPA